MFPSPRITTRSLAFSLLPCFAFLSSCTDADMALLAAAANGAAIGYAEDAGDAEAVSKLKDMQQDIINQASSESESTASASQSTTAPTYVSADPAPGRDGFVTSPYTNQLVDVRGIAAGQLVKDPTYTGTGKGYFRVPTSAGGSASTVARTSSSSSKGGLVGTWSNSKSTWEFNSDGTGKAMFGTTNNNGNAATHFEWKADGETFSYTITRITLENSTCYDYDENTKQTHKVPYRLSGNTLTLDRETLQRN